MSPTHVIKVGGSLLTWDQLPGRLARYLAGLRAARPVLIVGGGRATDLVRDLDQLHDLGPDRADALALRALDFTAQLLGTLLDAAAATARVEDLEATWAAGKVPILAPRAFLDELDRPGPDPLPRSWDVTTDSIAARLAEHLGASELILLKSAPIPPDADRVEAARLGLVDPAFPEVARDLRRVLYLNLRDPGATARPL